MRDHDSDEDEFGDDFNQWLIGATYEKPASSRKLFTTTEEESYRPKPLKIRNPKFDEYGDEIEDDGFRDLGGGEGRPSSSNPASKSISIRVTPVQHEKFIALGGSKWFKETLDVTLLPQSIL